MGRSQRPSFEELRKIYLLVGECRELGGDPIAWRLHMLDGLLGILGAHVGMLSDNAPLDSEGQASARTLVFVDHGWPNDSDRAVLYQFRESEEPNLCPWFTANHLRHVTQMNGRIATLLRDEVLSDRAWYGSAFFNDYVRCAHVDDLLSAQYADSLGQTHNLALHRSLGVRRFELRERRLLQRFIREIAWLAEAGKLAEGHTPSVLDLPPRLKEVLLLLMEGHSEKEAAARLRISQHTLHNHVKRLYGRFRVASRGALLARCRDLWPVLQANVAGRLATFRRPGHADNGHRGNKEVN